MTRWQPATLLWALFDLAQTIAGTAVRYDTSALSREEIEQAQICSGCRHRIDPVSRHVAAQRSRSRLLSIGRDRLSLVSRLLGAGIHLPAPSCVSVWPLLVPLDSGRRPPARSSRSNAGTTRDGDVGPRQTSFAAKGLARSSGRSQLIPVKLCRVTGGYRIR